MFRSVALVLLLLLSGCMSSDDVRRTVAANVWKLQDFRGSGSAFPVLCERAGARWRVTFLTAKHVVHGGLPVGWIAKLEGGIILAGGHVLSVHPSEDVALVQFVSRQHVEPVKIDARAPEFGERVWVAGYPIGVNLAITEGIAGHDGLATASIYPGVSGGPVIDFQGQIIGLADSMMVDEHETGTFPVTHVMYFVPLEDVTDWLERHEVPH